MMRWAEGALSPENEKSCGLTVENSVENPGEQNAIWQAV